MCVRKLIAILLLGLLCADFSYGGGSFDVELTSENDNSTERILYQAKNCVSDIDCHHLGKCETRDDGKFCDCKNGTSGDFCETVDDCAEELETCGTSDDVSCVYDVELEKTVCKCDNETKTYVPNKERCMSPCTRYNNCGINGYCLRKIGNQKFCACTLGAIGDYCEIIEWCHAKKVDCGVDNNVTCTLGVNGEAYCQCDDPTMGFDYDEKVCKDCAGCGENSYEGGCEYKGSKRICDCMSSYYSTEEGKCEDCKCGYSGYGCSFENGTKICKCLSDSSQKGDTCEKCDCGPGQSKCEFVGNKKVCTCKEGYAPKGKEGKCREMCNDTVPCQNGGKCVQNFCDCLKGTRGDLCETVEYCTGNKCGRGSECVYNMTSHMGYCKCKDPKEVFDDHYDYCRECDCGTSMRSCWYETGRKTCSCNIPYADKYGQCTLCNCKSHSSPAGCHFEYYNMICHCDEGYTQYEDDCKECDCGEYGMCALNYRGEKACKCNKGYIEDSGTCKKCYCGTNGYCSFDYEGNKTCGCFTGYQEYEGTCIKCDCGVYADCKLLGFNMKQCTCRSGYAMKYGQCTACNCYPGNDCTFDGLLRKKCICPERYADDGGTCKDCDCQVKGSNCSLASFVNTCQCPQGYEQVPITSRFLRTYCSDIDECQQHYACPHSTDCVNTIGSYDCVCKDGYEEYDFYDMKKDGCRDINECVRNFNPCNSPSARCVNTPGSYRCVCHEGYILYESHEEKMNSCISEMRPWRTATIVVGALSGVIIATLLLVVISRRYRL